MPFLPNCYSDRELLFNTLTSMHPPFCERIKQTDTAQSLSLISYTPRTQPNYNTNTTMYTQFYRLRYISNLKHYVNRLIDDMFFFCSSLSLCYSHGKACSSNITICDIVHGKSIIQPKCLLESPEKFPILESHTFSRR